MEVWNDLPYINKSSIAETPRESNRSCLAKIMSKYLIKLLIFRTPTTKLSGWLWFVNLIQLVSNNIGIYVCGFDEFDAVQRVRGIFYLLGK